MNAAPETFAPEARADNPQSGIEAARSRAALKQARALPEMSADGDRLMPAFEFLAITSFAAVIEGGLAWAVHGVPDGTIWALLAHIMMTALYGLWVLTVARRDREWGFPAITAMMLAVSGPLAPMTALAVWPLYKWYESQAIPFEEWYASLFPEIRSSLAADQYQAIMRGERSGESAVASFIDVLRRGSTDKKIAVIALLSKNFRPDFAPVLKLALSDETAAIRVQAATAVAKIEDRFVKQVQKIEAALNRAQDDLALKRELAMLYDAYAFTGILDAGRERSNREKALDLWIEVFEADPTNEEAWISVGRLLMRLKQHDVAANWFVDSVRGGHTTADVAAWYMEALFLLGRTSELRQVARDNLAKIEHAGDMPREVLEAARFWAGEAPGPRTDHPHSVAAR